MDVFLDWLGQWFISGEGVGVLLIIVMVMVLMKMEAPMFVCEDCGKEYRELKTRYFTEYSWTYHCPHCDKEVQVEHG